jgi:glycosyltransferase involved in cell wall biosynthesis
MDGTSGLAAPANAPPVSVIIPAYNASAYLGEALDSVARQLHAPIEVIVVDDGSEDAPERIVAAAVLPVRLIRQTNQGPGAARNAGLAVSTADLIAFLDADDLWADGALAGLVRHALAHPAADMVQGWLRRFVVEQPIDAAAPTRRVDRPQLSPNVSSILFRRRVFGRIGRFDSNFRPHEDVDLLFRAFGAGLCRETIDALVLHYRCGHGSVTERLPPDSSPPSAARLGLWLRLLHRSLSDRRRAAAGDAPQ